MEYDSVHECQEKKYPLASIRRRRRKDGGWVILELRKREGDYDCLDAPISFCPFCREKLGKKTE